MRFERRQSPCMTCLRVSNPQECENKSCKLWQDWFVARWALLHSYSRRVMDAPSPRLGECLQYLLHQVQDELLPNEKAALLSAATEFLRQ